ncbi:MAG TPA: hypothetical protein VGZ00_12010 [Candidatus Baltobacteraceae bacterium]|jgi:hypothetical protein|nr:hypothetical protein [Candidatus Baltobacteraceae bacterium]
MGTPIRFINCVDSTVENNHIEGYDNAIVDENGFNNYYGKNTLIASEKFRAFSEALDDLVKEVHQQSEEQAQRIRILQNELLVEIDKSRPSPGVIINLLNGFNTIVNALSSIPQAWSVVAAFFAQIYEALPR